MENGGAPKDPAERKLVEELVRSTAEARDRRTDRLLSQLLLAQWAAAVVLAAIHHPATAASSGESQGLLIRCGLALLWGGLLNLVPFALVLSRPGSFLARAALSCAQVLWAGLLAQITGVPEMHLQLFISLMVIGLYFDARLFWPAMILAALIPLSQSLPGSLPTRGAAMPEATLFLELWLALEALVIAVRIRLSIRTQRANAERFGAMQFQRIRYQTLLEGTSSVSWEMDPLSGTFLYMAPQASRILGWPAERFAEKDFGTEVTHPEDRALVPNAINSARLDTEVSVEYRLRRSDGHYIFVRSLLKLSRQDSKLLLRGTSIDITKERELEIGLRQAQKLESIGRLAASVAHEINTPVQFITDSVYFVSEAAGNLLRLSTASRSLEDQVVQGTANAAAAQGVTKLREEIDVRFLSEHIPKAASRALDGLGRVAAIARSMKEFARPEEKPMSPCDLNRGIEAALAMATLETEPVAVVEKHLGELPPVVCNSGDVNQVILNLVINSAQAIGESIKAGGKRGTIRIESKRDGDGVSISIQDNGAGIPEEVRSHIFEPFFSTKGTGRGSGQGLALARIVVQEQHGGRLGFESEVGKGTRFHLWLPVEGKPISKPAARP